TRHQRLRPGDHPAADRVSPPEPGIAWHISCHGLEAARRTAYLLAMSVLSESATPKGSDVVAQLLAGYRPLPDVYDEMMSHQGEVREHWHDLLAGLAALGREELSRRFAATDRYLRDSGVFYRVYEDQADVERGWPLTPIPLVIAPEEWESLQAALVERAHLVERVIADIYGAGNLFREDR